MDSSKQMHHLAPELNVEIVRAVPFMFDIAHDERMIKFNRAFRESGSFAKITRIDIRNFQRLNLPLTGSQLEAVESFRFARHGISNRAFLEECGRFAYGW